MECSCKQIVLLTIVACKFVSGSVAASRVCVVIWPVFTAGCSAVRQLILARRKLQPTGTGPCLVWCGQTRSGTTLKFLLEHNVFVM